MKTASMIAVLLVAWSAFGQEGQATLDIKVYRALPKITLPAFYRPANHSSPGPLTHFPAMDPKAKDKESVTLASPGTIALESEWFRVDDLEVQFGKDLLWNGQPEPSAPGIFLLSGATGIDFAESAVFELSQSAREATKKAASPGAQILFRRSANNRVRVWLRILQPPSPTADNKAKPVEFGTEDSGPSASFAVFAMHVEPEKWTCFLCGLSTLSGAPAGSLLIFLRTHGSGSPAPAPQPEQDLHCVEVKTIKLPEAVAAELRSRYQRVPGVIVSPEDAEVYRIGFEEPWSSLEWKSPLDWLNDRKGAELVSAPRITLKSSSDNTLADPGRSVFKVVMRNAPEPPAGEGAEETPPKGDDLSALLGEYAPALATFFEKHKDGMSGIIGDICSEYYFDDARQERIRFSYGSAAGVSLGQAGENVKATMYLNHKIVEPRGRGLMFWKKPVPPTFRDFPVELEFTFSDKETIGVLRPLTKPNDWLLYAICVTKAGGE